MSVEDFQVRKIGLRGAQKMADAYVVQARGWTDDLIKRERRATGRKTPAVIQSIAERWDIDYGSLWSLKYRPPRGVMTHVYMQLKAAYEAECERQEARLAHELMLAKAAGLHATNSRTVAEAEAFLGVASTKVADGGAQ